MFKTTTKTALVVCGAVLLVACTGGVHQSALGGTSGSSQYTVGGTVSGLTGSGLVLASSTGETLAIAGNGSFTFKTTYPSGSPYYVLALSQPSTPTQTCLVSNGAGTVNNAGITAITVACKDKTTPTDAIGGMVVGLTGAGLIVQNNGTDTLTITADGAFAFSTPLPSGSQYDITVLSAPIKPYEDCVVLNGKGTTTDSDIANIAVACTVNTSPTHIIGGTVTGVSGTLVLEDNARDDITITANGGFKFPLPLPSGSTYSVTTKSVVGGQSQACTFANATGTVGGSDINDVTVVCQANLSLQASVSGLSGTGLVLQNTIDADTLAVSANGTSTFAAGLAPGGTYNVSVVGQPSNPTQTCVVANGVGTGAAGATVTVTCTTNTYAVSGVVTGLPDPNSGANHNLVLQNNQGDNITIAPTANSPVPFTFATPVPSGSAYSVAVLSQPGVDTTFGTPGVIQTSTVCIVSAAAGSVTNANITNVVVNCVRPLGFAYVTNSADNTISPYVIDSATGALLPSGPAVSTGNAPSAASPDGNGTFLYVTNRGSNDLSGYAIDPNIGTLTPFTGSPFSPGLSAPTSIAPFYSSAGDGLYVTNGGAGTIGAFTVGTSGTTLANIGGSPFATQAGPTAGLFLLGATSPVFYLDSNAGSNTVSVYAADINTGTLTPALNSPFATGTRPSSVAAIQTFVAASGSYVDNVYVANSGDGTISSYSMNTATGTLAPPQSFNAGAGLSAVAAASCGCFLFASTVQGIAVFTANSTGSLAPVTGSPFVAGSGPGPLATRSNYVFVINTVDQTVSVFSLNAATGALTPVGSTPVKTGRTPSSLVVIGRPAFG